MIAVNSEKWLNDIVVVKLLPASVLLMDIVPYHWRQMGKLPSVSALKRENWLERHRVHVTVP
jgi:hypothetical protein